MSDPAVAAVPFVDLSLQHQPLRSELDRVIAATIDRGDYILGRAVAEFEQAWAAACGVAYGVGVGNGTEAIALGLTACGIGPGDEVIAPANTFIATVIGIAQAGARPVLVDCDPETALIDLAAAEAAITPKTKAIAVVHLYGQVVDPIAVKTLADRHNLTIFEDAAQAHLAERDGHRAGTIGRAASFSFYPSKNLGAIGDGGAIVTNDEAIARKVQSLRNYGSPKKYHHPELGGNSRLDTLQAAVLNVKLPHLAEWNRQRNAAAAEYDRLLAPLAPLGIRPLQNQAGAGHIYHLYVIRVEPTCRLSRDELMAALADRHISTTIHYPIPCHRQGAFAHLGYGPGAFPVAETLADQILSLPIYSGITIAQIEQVVGAIATILAS